MISYAKVEEAVVLFIYAHACFVEIPERGCLAEDRSVADAITLAGVLWTGRSGGTNATFRLRRAQERVAETEAFNIVLHRHGMGRCGICSYSWC